MPPWVALLVYALGILGLFWLDRDKEEHPSKALWVPVFWLLINGSRSLSAWLEFGPRMVAPNMVLDGSPLDAALYAAILALALPVMFLRIRKVATVLRANFPILIFFGYCGMSVIWSDFPFVALKRWVKVVADLIMVLIILTDNDQRAAIKCLLKRIGFLLIPISILLIKYFPDMGRGYDQWDGTLYNIGVATNKNLLGMTSLMVGIGTLWRFLQTYRSPKGGVRTRQLIAEGLLLSMSVYLLWISNSVTSLSCFGLASFLLIGTTFFSKARSPLGINTLVVGEIAFVIFALFFSSGGQILETMGRNPTLTGRTEIWQLVLGMDTHPLLGAGFESFWLGERLTKVWNIYWFHLNEAHNGYIELFLNLGWIGVLMFAAVMVTGYRHVVESFRQDLSMAQVRLAYFVTAAIYSLTEVGFRMLSPVWIFFLFSAIVIPKSWYEAGAMPDEGNKADAGKLRPATKQRQALRPADPLIRVRESKKIRAQIDGETRLV